MAVLTDRVLHRATLDDGAVRAASAVSRRR